MFVKLDRISPLLEVKKKHLDTVDGRSPANQLKLVLCPTIYTILYILSAGCLGFLPPTVDHDLSLNFVELTIDLLHHNISRGRGRWWRLVAVAWMPQGIQDSRYIPRKWTWNPKGEGPFQGVIFMFQGWKCFLEEINCSPQELNDFNLKDHHTSGRWSHDERCLVSFLLIKFAKYLHYGTHLHHRLKYEIDFFVNLLITKYLHRP